MAKPDENGAPTVEQVEALIESLEVEDEVKESLLSRYYAAVTDEDQAAMRRLLIRAGITLTAFAVSGPAGVAIAGYNIADEARNRRRRAQGLHPVGWFEG